uniref:Uncharacterized protein n=1 Tax=Rhizoctonia cerealis phyllomonavirus TaxID=3068671 RepID=A0AA51BSD1_9MONO|nr:MAG: hypothetical protein [Rhizoctonia cerealis phyllomonavirus]
MSAFTQKLATREVRYDGGQAREIRLLTPHVESTRTTLNVSARSNIVSALLRVPFSKVQNAEGVETLILINCIAVIFPNFIANAYKGISATGVQDKFVPMYINTKDAEMLSDFTVTEAHNSSIVRYGMQFTNDKGGMNLVIPVLRKKMELADRRFTNEAELGVVAGIIAQLMAWPLAIDDCKAKMMNRIKAAERTVRTDIFPPQDDTLLKDLYDAIEVHEIHKKLAVGLRMYPQASATTRKYLVNAFWHPEGQASLLMTPYMTQLKNFMSGQAEIMNTVLMSYPWIGKMHPSLKTQQSSFEAAYKAAEANEGWYARYIEPAGTGYYMFAQYKSLAGLCIKILKESVTTLAQLVGPPHEENQYRAFVYNIKRLNLNRPLVALSADGSYGPQFTEEGVEGFDIATVDENKGTTAPGFSNAAL